MKLFILAGGLGTRMRPVSFAVPKPLIAYKKKPILEHILENAIAQKLDDIVISLGYGAELIRAYCRVKKWDVKFVEEEIPLGTAGPLSLLNFQDKVVVVMNGDIITDMDFELLKNVHVKCGSDITIACKKIEYRPSFGVINCDVDDKFIGITERPLFNHLASCGIYAVSKNVINCLSIPMDFPTLINKVYVESGKVGVFNLDSYGFGWKAIENLEQAEED